MLLLLASLTAAWWEPYQTDAQDSAHTLAGPSGSHWLGTDELGRDVLTRIAAGSWISVGPALLAVVVAFGIGIPLALAAAEHGRWVERGSSRFAELLLALPAIVILLAFVGAVGVHPWAIMTVLGVLLSAPVYRVFLSQAQSLRTRLYVDAARVNGVSSVQVNLRHVLPAMATTIAVQAAQLFAIGVLIEAGLAFLGFGPSIPSPSWGGLIAAASQHIYDDPWLMVPTGVVLALTVIAANVLADAVGGGERRAQAATRRGSGSAVPSRPMGTMAATPPADPGVLLDVRDLAVSVGGRTGPGDRRLVRGARGDGARPRRRVRLRQDDDRARPARAAARRSGGDRRDHRVLRQGDGRDLTALTERELRAVRGPEIALISQEPMVALDPMFSVGYQLSQPIRRFRGSAGPRRGGSPRNCSARSASSTQSGCCAATRISCPAAWRSGSASRSRSPGRRSCSSPTSRPPHST